MCRVRVGCTRRNRRRSSSAADVSPARSIPSAAMANADSASVSVLVSVSSRPCQRTAARSKRQPGLHNLLLLSATSRRFPHRRCGLGSLRRPLSAMTSQGTAHGRFTRAIQTRNLWAAETAMRELGTVSLLDALDYLELLAASPAWSTRRGNPCNRRSRQHPRPAKCAASSATSWPLAQRRAGKHFSAAASRATRWK